jgi:hypothetical protein
MRWRRIVYVTILSSLVEGGTPLLGCATTANSADTLDASEIVPFPDSGPDGAEEPARTIDGSSGADGSETDAAETCSPDALCPNEVFDMNNSADIRTRIFMIRGRSANDVWAAGTAGTILHFDGRSWTQSAADTSASVVALWLPDAGEVALTSLSDYVYLRGFDSRFGLDGGTHTDSGAVFDGGADSGSAGDWTAQAPSSFNATNYPALTSAWAPSDAGWLWCTLSSGSVYVGTTSSAQDPNGLMRLRVTDSAVEVAQVAPLKTCAVYPCGAMTSIHGASADDLWAVGLAGSTIHITNAQGTTPKLTPVNSQKWSDLHGVWAASENDVWSVGGRGVIRHYTGGLTSWDVVPNVPTVETLRAVWGSSATDIWAVGDNATVLHYDGSTWSQVRVAGLRGRRPNLMTVWAPAPGRVWVGGVGAFLTLGGEP